MKKLINGIVLVIVIVLAVLLGISLKQTQTTTQDYNPEKPYVAHSGFERHEDVAEAYVKAMVEGDIESVIGLMNKDMIASIATENFTTDEVVRSALSRWYGQEQAYYAEWLYENFPYSTSPPWYIGEIRWEKEECLEDLDYGWGIADYDYYEMRHIGTTDVIYYGAGVYFSDIHNEYEENSGFSIWFAVAKINGLWYLVGID